MNITYEHDRAITGPEFIDLLRRSTLAERRPVGNAATIEAMLQYGNLLCTAWHGQKLIGVARSLTDFEYCCYLSDLAVDEAYQKKGIGRELIRLTQSRLGSETKIILLAAPKAQGYYARIGFDSHSSAWIISASKNIL